MQDDLMGDQRRRQGQIVQAVLRHLEGQEDPVPAKEVIETVAAGVQLTEYEASDYPSSPGVRRFDKILRFATIPAVKAGWLFKSKGRWTVTPEGLAALRQYTDPDEFQRVAQDRPA